MEGWDSNEFNFKPIIYDSSSSSSSDSESDEEDDDDELTEPRGMSLDTSSKKYKKIVTEEELLPE